MVGVYFERNIFALFSTKSFLLEANRDWRNPVYRIARFLVSRLRTHFRDDTHVPAINSFTKQPAKRVSIFLVSHGRFSYQSHLENIYIYGYATRRDRLKTITAGCRLDCARPTHALSGQRRLRLYHTNSSWHQSASHQKHSVSWDSTHWKNRNGLWEQVISTQLY